jgi:hypothetical protein
LKFPLLNEIKRTHAASWLVVHVFELSFLYAKLLLYLYLFFSWSIMEKHTEDMKIGQQFFLFDQYYGWNKSCA